MGIILYELCCGGPPIPHKNNIKAMMLIMKNPAPEIPPKKFSKELIDFSKCLLKRDVNKRSSASELKLHPFIT